jgi:probable HAF family extracellular repeat protein
MKSRTLTCIAAITLFAAMAVLVQLAAQQKAASYTVTDLGTLGGTFSDTGGVNNQGQAVGGSTVIGDTAIHAFLWNKGVISDLGTLGGPNSFANAVSNTTGAVGLSDISNSPGNPNLCFEEFVNTTNQCRAFLWQNGVMSDLGTLDGASSTVLADGVNSRAEVVGGAETAIPDPNNPPYQIFHAFLWERGEMTDLGTLGGPNSIAFGINDKDQVVGQSEISSTASPSCGCLPAHAFLLKRGSAMRDLGTLGGDFSNALISNNQGQIVGASTLAGNVNAHAFLWQDGVMTDLGTLPAPLDFFSFANDISSKGQVVGNSCDANFNCDAFIWEGGVMTDLNTLTPSDSDLQLVTAFQINSRGRINGTAIQKSTGQTRAYLATPTNGGTAHLSPKIILPENVRKLLRQRLAWRYHIPRIAGSPRD